jgi:hypothetical protein
MSKNLDQAEKVYNVFKDNDKIMYVIECDDKYIDNLTADDFYFNFGDLDEVIVM